MTSTIFLSLLILFVGFILRNAIYKVKQRDIKERCMYDICEYLNSQEVYIRDKKSKTHKFKAHIVHHVDKDDDIIIIDLI
jgi:hypothetical protein